MSDFFFLRKSTSRYCLRQGLRNCWECINWNFFVFLTLLLTTQLHKASTGRGTFLCVFFHRLSAFNDRFWNNCWTWHHMLAFKMLKSSSLDRHWIWPHHHLYSSGKAPHKSRHSGTKEGHFGLYCMCVTMCLGDEFRSISYGTSLLAGQVSSQVKCWPESYHVNIRLRFHWPSRFSVQSRYCNIVFDPISVHARQIASHCWRFGHVSAT